MNKTKIVVASIAAVLAARGAASADIWRCNYTGTWSSDDGNGGEFSWELRWEGRPGGEWHLIGDYTDRYGDSTLDGNCRDKHCRLEQHYTRGELAGKRFYWQGHYSDEHEGPNRSINRFSGTWGDAPDRRSNGGTWRAKAECRRHERERDRD